MNIKNGCHEQPEYLNVVESLRYDLELFLKEFYSIITPRLHDVSLHHANMWFFLNVFSHIYNCNTNNEQER